MAGLEFQRYRSGIQVMYQIYADAGSVYAYLVEAVGYRNSQFSAPGNKIDYVCTKEQGETIKLLYENGFKGVGKKINSVYRPNNHPTSIEQALAAIKRGDYVVENFLDAVDGA